MILSALRRCQSIQPPSKALLSSLALTDLVVGLVVLPLFTAYYLTIILEIPTYYCTIAVTYGRISTFIGSVSLGTIATIAIDRYLAFHLRLRYRDIVKFRRVVLVLIIEWILATFWSGSWFWSARASAISGIVGLFMCCLITVICYLSIYRGIRRHIAQIHPHATESGDFNVLQYKKTVNSMVWIFGVLLVCYIPHLTSMFVILLSGLSNASRFVLHFSAIVIYFNSFLNPILYCWRIRELNEKVIGGLHTLYNFFSYHSSE